MLGKTLEKKNLLKKMYKINLLKRLMIFRLLILVSSLKTLTMEKKIGKTEKRHLIMLNNTPESDKLRTDNLAARLKEGTLANKHNFA